MAQERDAVVAGEEVIRVQSSGTDLDRLQFLRAEIDRHDMLYHRDGAPEITDAEYDQLKREFLALSARDTTLGDRDGGIVGRSSTDDHVPGFLSHRHREPMLSLEKAYTLPDLRRFHQRLAELLRRQQLEFVIEPKFDGLAVSAVYEGGQLVAVVTRGDGFRGDVITDSATKFTPIPTQLKPLAGRAFPTRVEVRGEIVVSRAEFDRLNAEREAAGEAGYVSPRNLAAGTLRSLAAADAPLRRLSVVFYGMGGVAPESDRPSSQQALRTRLADWGLPTVEEQRLAQSVETLWSEIQSLRATQASLPYPTDGLVVKLDSMADQRGVGATEEAPRWAIAFKFAPERQTTRLSAITLQVGRTGVVTPVAELEPVQVGGAMVRRATLHNAEAIARRDLRIGDYVMIERGGDVIPAIVGVDFTRRLASSRPFVFPGSCPGCSAPLQRFDPQRAWRCVNQSCSAQLKRRLLHFVSPACVGIRGLGRGTLDTLVDAGRVTNLSDLYRLRPEDFSGIGPMESATSVLAAISHSRNADVWRFIYGMSIPGVGAASSRLLAAHFGGLKALSRAEPREFERVPGLSVDAARNAAAHFSAAEVRKMVDDWDLRGVGQNLSPTP